MAKEDQLFMRLLDVPLNDNADKIEKHFPYVCFCAKKLRCSNDRESYSLKPPEVLESIKRELREK